jgi:hypothetical protein
MPVTINGTTGITTPAENTAALTVGSITGILKATSGVVSQAVAGTDYLAVGSGGTITLGTARTAPFTAPNTYADFTGIPSWAKRITVMFRGLSTSGSSVVQIQIGSGSITNSLYSATASYSNGVGLFLYATSGFILDVTNSTGLTVSRSGILQITLIDSNTWVANGNNSSGFVGQVSIACSGTSPQLGGALDILRITTVNGSDTFDAGTINISYE